MVADPSGRLLLALGVLAVAGGVTAVLGQPLAAALCSAALLGVLGWIVAGEIQNRRWAARVARWDRPEVWRILDAVRDREDQRDRDAAAWAALTGRLAAVLDGLAAGFEGVAIDVGRHVETIVGTFDGRHVGFGDRMIAEAQREEPGEVRYL